MILDRGAGAHMLRAFGDHLLSNAEIPHFQIYMKKERNQYRRVKQDAEIRTGRKKRRKKQVRKVRSYTVTKRPAQSKGLMRGKAADLFNGLQCNRKYFRLPCYAACRNEAQSHIFFLEICVTLLFPCRQNKKEIEEGGKEIHDGKMGK
jgi:hypothetical protein